MTTFHYGQITGIEYNAGMLNGVLEILTPSYQGTANKDLSRGAGRSTNSDSNNPFQLSNTLPLSKGLYSTARAQIDWLNQRVADAKRPAIVQPPASTSDLAGQLARLGELHTQGILEADEFKKATQALIAKHAR